jgi:hypothetical protein
MRAVLRHDLITMTTKPGNECGVGGKEIQITGRLPKMAHVRGEYYARLEDPGSFVQEVKRAGLRADILTFIQDISDPIPRYAFHHEPEKVALLPITTYETWFAKQLYNKPRNTLRKALKSGLEIRLEQFSESLIEGIKAVYDETPVRQGKRNRHYAKDLETLKREHATFLDRSQFIVAYYAGETIGFAKVTFSREYGIFMNFLSKVSHRDKAVNNAILAKAVEICAERKLKCLIYGGWGSGGTRGLDEFKLSNGFECVEVPRYFVPLTWLGRMSLKAGVHRGLVHQMPEWFVKAAAKARKRWNTLRFSVLKRVTREGSTP